MHTRMRLRILHNGSDLDTIVKPVLSGHSKIETNIGFQSRLSLNAGQKYCSILQYFRPSLSYHLPLGPLFCLFLSVRLRQVLLYNKVPVGQYT